MDQQQKDKDYQRLQQYWASNDGQINLRIDSKQLPTGEWKAEVEGHGDKLSATAPNQMDAVSALRVTVNKTFMDNRRKSGQQSAV